jgi:hypothetical protein
MWNLIRFNFVAEFNFCGNQAMTSLHGGEQKKLTTNNLKIKQTQERNMRN